MANPFLVLGGVAVGVVTAGIGVLAVPGWINSAQDANSIQDLSLISDAQSARLTNDGAYAPTLAALENAQGVKVKTSADTRVYSAASPDGSHWAAVSRSKTGTYFARLSQASKVGQGTSIEQAITNAGTTITGATGARVTAQGVPLPAPYELADIIYTNLHANPGGVETQGFGVWAGSQVEDIAINQIVDVGWSTSGKALRATWTSTANSSSAGGYVSSRVTPNLEGGKTYTAVARVVSNSPRTVTPGIKQNSSDLTAVDSSGPTTLTPGVPSTVYVTVAYPSGTVDANTHLMLRWLTKRAGDYMEVSDLDVYEGGFDPSRPVITDQGGSDSSLQYARTGKSSTAPTVAYR